jgi:hypothetical protein
MGQERYILGGTPKLRFLFCLPRIPVEGRHMSKSQSPTQLPPSSPEFRRAQRTRGLSRYKRSETARLVRGALDAGLTVRGIEADPVTGALRILVGKGDEPIETVKDLIK